MRLFMFLLAGWSLVLTGCGFHLRNTESLPFASAVVEADVQSALGPQLRQALKDQTKLADKAEAATLHIHLTMETRTKNILSLSSGGQVREYRLTYQVTVRVLDGFGVEAIAPFTIQLSRDYSYSDAQALAKQAEEVALNRDMEQEALRQVLRRLSYFKQG